MAHNQQLLGMLNQLQHDISGVRGVMLAASDGIPLAHNFPESAAGRIGAMAAAALGLAKRVTVATQMGDLSETTVRGEKGYLLIFSAGPKGVLIVAAALSVDLLEATHKARTLAQRIAPELEGVEV
ncbi:MAG: roadblock/LC7 domain-containing protein [Meiothermus sp.]|nr:roadblock/LC7 domain-containing protein [Meiothermus sp.]